MKIVRADQLEGTNQSDQPSQDLDWVEGPHTAERLDVGIVRAAPGSRTPPHLHHGGQVMVVIEGAGFVETTDGERVVMREGDVVIAEPGEEHVHGALDDTPVTHLTVTTGRHGVRPSD